MWVGVGWWFEVTASRHHHSLNTALQVPIHLFKLPGIPRGAPSCIHPRQRRRQLRRLHCRRSLWCSGPPCHARTAGASRRVSPAHHHVGTGAVVETQQQLPLPLQRGMAPPQPFTQRSSAAELSFQEARENQARPLCSPGCSRTPRLPPPPLLTGLLVAHAVAGSAWEGFSSFGPHHHHRLPSTRCRHHLCRRGYLATATTATWMDAMRTAAAVAVAVVDVRVAMAMHRRRICSQVSSARTPRRLTVTALTTWTIVCTR